MFGMKKSAVQNEMIFGELVARWTLDDNFLSKVLRGIDVGWDIVSFQGAILFAA